MKLCRICCLPVEPAYAATDDRCESCTQDAWVAMNLRGEEKPHFRLQAPKPHPGPKNPGLSDAEIGAALNLPASTVYAARMKVYSRFLERLEDEAKV